MESTCMNLSVLLQRHRLLLTLYTYSRRMIPARNRTIISSSRLLSSSGYCQSLGPRSRSTVHSNISREFSATPAIDPIPKVVEKGKKATLPKAPSSPLRGTKDLFPDVTRYYNFIETEFKETLQKYGYRNEVRTPIIEHKDVFNSTLGADSEVVMKQMYLFDDHGTPTVLRPECTASVMRALVKRGVVLPPQNSDAAADGTVSAETFVYPDKLFYCGPMFRRERPQAGRLRQFTQFGVECVGSDHIIDDVQVIAMARDSLAAIGLLPHLTLAINSLGVKEDRERYHGALMNYLSHYRGLLSRDSQRRVDENTPLRVLDSKESEDVVIARGMGISSQLSSLPPVFLRNREELVAEGLISAEAVWPPTGAPVLRDYLCPASKHRFDAVLAGLDAAGVSYVVDDYLLRGLDYYSHTAFEFLIRTDEDGSVGTAEKNTPTTAAAGDAAASISGTDATAAPEVEVQRRSLAPGNYSAVLGGGRYDGLSLRFGDKTANNSTAIGWAAGLDRLYLHLQTRGMLPSLPAQADVAIVVMMPKGKRADEYHEAFVDVSNNAEVGDSMSAFVSSKAKEVVLEGVKEGKQSNNQGTAAVLTLTAFKIAQKLRSEGLNVVFEPNLPFRTQLVQTQGAKFAVVVGEEEVVKEEVVVKHLGSRTQEKVPLDTLCAWVHEHMIK